jgi:hypothetical protein
MIMNTTKYQINIMVMFLVLLFGTNSYSQSEVKHKKLFARAFNFEGKKIGKGYITVLTDSTFELSRGNEYLSISLKDIGYIKTKRSVGNNFLIGSIAGATTMGILGAATADPDAWIFGYTAAEGALGFGLIGAIGGGAIGGITSIFKNSKTIVINGNQDKWELFRKILE